MNTLLTLAVTLTVLHPGTVAAMAIPLFDVSARLLSGPA